MNQSIVGRTLYKILRLEKRPHVVFSRTLVSEAFQCQEAWGRRLESQIIANIRPNLGEFFMALDRKFGTEYRGSALDVDIFANAVDTESELEHLEELLFKLRRTPHTVNSPPSTNHAAVRVMLSYGESEDHLQHLVKMLEDRTNYGLFLDQYTAVLLLDRLLRDQRLVAGARVASHLMLQEEGEPVAASMGNLACWRYVASGRTQAWYNEDEVELVPEEDQEEVVRVRVKGMVPNNHNDDHFDLREPDKILGKTLWYLNRQQDDPIATSLRLLGLILWGKLDKVKEVTKGVLVQEIVDKVMECNLNDDVRLLVENSKKVQLDTDAELVNGCKALLKEHEGRMIKNQTQLYKEWGEKRELDLQAENDALNRRTKIEDISRVKENLAREEQRLFFFSNLDRLDQEKEEKSLAWRRTFPRRNWSRPGFFSSGKYVKKPDQEQKEARWERREKKRGPPK